MDLQGITLSEISKTLPSDGPEDPHIHLPSPCHSVRAFHSGGTSTEKWQGHLSLLFFILLPHTPSTFPFSSPTRMHQGNRNQLLINSYCQLRCQWVFDIEPGRWGHPHENLFLEWLTSKMCCQFLCVCVTEQKMWLFYFKLQASFLIVLMTPSWAQNSETGKRRTAENQHAIIEQRLQILPVYTTRMSPEEHGFGLLMCPGDAHLFSVSLVQLLQGETALSVTFPLPPPAVYSIWSTTLFSPVNVHCPSSVDLRISDCPTIKQNLEYKTLNFSLWAK